ncbi:hypothetical protein Rs2_02974 [Raphanus sativus]|nr:hypothetical protein Rs2_02974 [Raphanus sativus]
MAEAHQHKQQTPKTTGQTRETKRTSGPNKRNRTTSIGPRSRMPDTCKDQHHLGRHVPLPLQLDPHHLETSPEHHHRNHVSSELKFPQSLLRNQHISSTLCL